MTGSHPPDVPAPSDRPPQPTSTTVPAPLDPPAPSDPAAPFDPLEVLDRRLAEVRAGHHERDRRARTTRRALWLAHHWPEHYQQRCVAVGPVLLCRRCLALYPLALVMAVASVAGLSLWPTRFDPWLIWALSLPATVAYVGEAVGWFSYRARWQVATTLLAALALGRALGLELLDRWQPAFWGPVAVFGAIWFAATVIGHRLRASDQSAATASSSSSSVL